MESHLNQVSSNQVIQEQRSQRDLEIQAEELQAKNNILDEHIAAQKESDEELRIAKERLASQTIDIPDGEDDIEHFLRASSAQVNLVEPPLNAEARGFDQTLRESVASKGSQQQMRKCFFFYTSAKSRYFQPSLEA